MDRAEQLIRADFALYRKENRTQSVLAALEWTATLFLLLLTGWLLMALPQ